MHSSIYVILLYPIWKMNNNYLLHDSECQWQWGGVNIKAILEINWGWGPIKVDLEKAYDRLRWSFIEDTLRDVGIPKFLYKVIMQCISSYSMIVLWNGGWIDEFKLTWGIFQGDLLSSYIFVLYMERLSLFIIKEVNNGN